MEIFFKSFPRVLEKFLKKYYLDLEFLTTKWLVSQEKGSQRHLATVGEKRGEVSHLTYESTKLSAERQEEKCNLSSNEQQNNYVETE